MKLEKGKKCFINIKAMKLNKEDEVQGEILGLIGEYARIKYVNPFSQTEVTEYFSRFTGWSMTENQDEYVTSVVEIIN